MKKIKNDSESKTEKKKKKIAIPPSDENLWINPEKVNRTRFDFRYKKKQNKEEHLNVKKEKSAIEKALESLHSLFFD